MARRDSLSSTGDGLRSLGPAALILLAASPALAEAPKALSTAQLLSQSAPADWRPLDPNDTLYVDLPRGRVIIELAPAFAPHHAQNLRRLAHGRYFDGLAILRAQDNYVVQWGDPDDDDPKKAKPLGDAERKLPAEFSRSSEGLPFAALPDPDTYAPEVGFSSGFPVARDPKTHEVWLAHCYGAVGAARDVPKDSSSMPETTRPTRVMLRSRWRGLWPMTTYSSLPLLLSVGTSRAAPTAP